MATHKDQLNAYTFARRRTVGAFLQPSSTGVEAEAPRALRALLPSIVTGALVLAAFGAWGMIKPGAPLGWDNTGENVLVGSESTTRYVVLETDGVKQLHPVLNLASAKLLLDPQKFKVLKVDEKVLDGPKLPHGATVGIPNAPDRLPGSQAAAQQKVWAVCQQPAAGGGQAARQAVFVLSQSQASQVLTPLGTLTGAKALYVQGPDGVRYLVDGSGTRFPLGGATDATKSLLVRMLFDDSAQPEQVGAQWLATLNLGSTLDFPVVPGFGQPSTAPGLDARSNKVGMVVEAASGAATHKYVVLKDRIAPVSELTAHLLMNSQQAVGFYPGDKEAAIPVAAAAVSPDTVTFYADKGWPTAIPTQVNGTAVAGGSSSQTVCGVMYQGKVDAAGRPSLGAWAGPSFPVTTAGATSSVYVTPGSGLLYREVSGVAPAPGSAASPAPAPVPVPVPSPSAGAGAGDTDTLSGSVYLLTDTGLRYSLPANNDSTAKGVGAGAGVGVGKTDTGGAVTGDQARTRLGYDKIDPTVVPQQWSQLLPKGPTLDTASARETQGA